MSIGGEKVRFYRKEKTLMLVVNYYCGSESK